MACEPSPFCSLLPEIPISCCATVGSRESSIANDGETGSKETATRTFLLRFATPLEDLRSALHYSEIPVINDPYPCAEWMLVQSKDVEEVDGRLLFIVNVHYEVPPINEFTDDPVLNDWVLSTDIREEEVVLEQDYTVGDGGPYLIKNSAGDWFNPPMMATEYIHVLTLQKNLATWDLGTEYTFENTINNADITIAGFLFPKHCLLCTRHTTTGKEQSEQGEYYPLMVQLLYRSPKVINGDVVDRTIAGGATTKGWSGACGTIVGTTSPGWDEFVIDRGFNHSLPGVCQSADSKFQRGLDEKGKPLSQAGLLNGAGILFRNSTNYDPVYLPFQVFDESAFSGMSLPATIP